MTQLLPKSLFNHPFFRDPFEAFAAPIKGLGKMDFPNTNYETYTEDGQFVTVFNVPGHSGMDDIKADVDKETGLLKVESRKVNEEKKESEERTYYHRGESKCSYALYLPQEVDLESASAKCESGQLKIIFNLKDEATLSESKTLSIPIEVQIDKV